MPPPHRRKLPRSGALTELPPKKIIRSILLLQLSYYVIAAILISFTAIVAGQQFSLTLLFDWRTVRGDNTLGWLLGIVWLCVALFAVMILLFLISRSKLVPDFALTLHFLHLLTTSLYTGRIPSNVLWWGLQTASAAVMVGLGIWACRYRELRPISFGLGSRNTNNNSNNSNNSNKDDDGSRRHRENTTRDAEEGELEAERLLNDEVDDQNTRPGGRHGRGKNRSAQAPGGSSYEMIGLGLKPSENG